MHKINFVFLFFFVGLISSCSNLDTNDPIPEPEPEEPVGVVVEGCDSFTEALPSLNTATIDFECNGNPFSEEGALSDDNLTGTWGRFGGAAGTAFLKLGYANNPNPGDVNSSSKVLSISEDANIEPWAGFFFNLNEKITFPAGQEAISIDVHSAAPGQSVLLKIEDSSNSDNFKEVIIVTTASGAWEKLVYNFSAEDNNKYDRIVIIAASTTTNSTATTHYIDNIAFSTPVVVEEPDSPTSAPTAPTLDAADVMSVFSDSYTDVAGTDFNPNWGQSTQVSNLDLDGNSVIKYANLNYQGTAFASPLNVSGYTSIHVDYWTSDSTALNFFLISSGEGKEKAKALDVSNLGQWNSVDIALTDFSDVVDLSDVIQFKVDGNGTVFFDNIYFHDEVGTTGVNPFTNLVWSDEFDYEGRPNSNKWHHQTYAPNGGSWYNGEAQHYVDKSENSFVSDGTLKIAAIKENFTTQGVTKQFTSARMNSKFKFKYGKVEIRAKLPEGPGTWPAIWTLGANINEPGNFYGDSFGSVGWPNCGEIDIMEQNGWNKSNLYGYCHWGDTETGEYKNSGAITNISNSFTEFHIYSLIWNENKILILVDGKVFFELLNDSRNPFDNEHYVLFNIALGGNLGGNIPSDFVREVMEIDYIRIYK